MSELSCRVLQWKRCVGVALDVIGILGQHSHIVVDEAFGGCAGRLLCGHGEL